MNPSSKDLAFGDLDRELAVTRRVLERMPEEHFGFKPHEKSMSLGRLAMHVATLPQWMADTIRQDGLDFAAPPPPMRTEPKDRADLLETFDRWSKEVKDSLARMEDSALERAWTMRNGAQVLHSQPKRMILRTWCLNHMIHHRAQLCIYLRLLNVPVPTVYFNTADDPTWVFE